MRTPVSLILALDHLFNFGTHSCVHLKVDAVGDIISPRGGTELSNSPATTAYVEVQQAL